MFSQWERGYVSALDVNSTSTQCLAHRHLPTLSKHASSEVCPSEAGACRLHVASAICMHNLEHMALCSTQFHDPILFFRCFDSVHNYSAQLLALPSAWPAGLFSTVFSFSFFLFFFSFLFCPVVVITECPCGLTLKSESFKKLMPISPQRAWERRWFRRTIKQRGQSCLMFLTNCGCQNEGTQASVSQSCWQAFSILYTQHTAPTDFLSRCARLALPQTLSARKAQHAVRDKETKSGLNGLCREREEHICFSSTASLCLSYRMFPVLMALGPLNAGNPEWLPPPQPNQAMVVPKYSTCSCNQSAAECLWVDRKTCMSISRVLIEFGTGGCTPFCHYVFSHFFYSLD